MQVLANNLLYDLSQVPIPADDVDPDWLVEAAARGPCDDIRRFILLYRPSAAPSLTTRPFLSCSTCFNCLGQPGACSRPAGSSKALLTQTLIIHVIRTKKVPFLQSRASTPIILTSIGIVIFGAWLTVSPFASTLGFVSLPALYWPILLVMMILYITLTQLVKTWYYKKFGD